MPNAPNVNAESPAHDRQCCAQSLDQNRLLAALSARDLSEVSNKLELVELRRGGVLHSPSQSLQYAYFPTTAVVSLQYTCSSGETAEIADVGCEGVVGLALFMGVSSTTTSALVQLHGHAFRLHARHAREVLDRCDALRGWLLRYAQLLLAKIAQTSVCNRHHRVEQQVCRWLLSMLDRVPSGKLQATHEVVAAALGVRREGVTEVAGNLQRAGVIRYRRGHVEVLERDGLEARVCECYAVVRRAAHNQHLRGEAMITNADRASRPACH